MSQEQIETLISKIWSRMPEIFDQNHDWVGDLLSKEPEVCYLFAFYAAPSIGLLLHLSKGKLVHCIDLMERSLNQKFQIKFVPMPTKWKFKTKGPVKARQFIMLKRFLPLIKRSILTRAFALSLSSERFRAISMTPNSSSQSFFWQWLWLSW